MSEPTSESDTSQTVGVDYSSPTFQPNPSNPYQTETTADREARIYRLFSSLKPNENGLLDADGILRGFERLTHLPARTKYARELLQRCDTSHDGMIDFTEFKDYVLDKERELWQLFLQIDKSGDGRLQPEELEAALKLAGIRISEDDFMRFMDAMDVDQDGVIDFQEWRDFLLLLPRETNIVEIYQYYQISAQVTPDGEVVIPPTDEAARNAFRYLLAGGIAGAVSRTCTAPFDRLKVFLITQSSPTVKSAGNAAANKATTSVLGAIEYLYANGGFRAFFVGNGLNIIKVVPEQAIKFTAFEWSKSVFARISGAEDKNSISNGARFVAGGIAGLCSQFSIYPIETLKARIMCTKTVAPIPNTHIPPNTAASNPHKATCNIPDTSHSRPAYAYASKSQHVHHYQTNSTSHPIRYQSANTIQSHMSHPLTTSSVSKPVHEKPAPSASLVISTARQMYAQKGLKAFWPGLTLGLVGVFPYQALDMGIYDVLKMHYLAIRNEKNDLDGKQEPPNLFVLWGCGMLSSCIGATSVYPLNMIRTRLQAQGTPGHPQTYTSAFDAARKLYLADGVLGFYKGLGPSLFKVIPAVSISYVVYEQAKRGLDIA